MKYDISQQAHLPTRFGDFLAVSFREYLEKSNPLSTPSEHLVVFTQNLGEVPLVRIHSECLTGDVFGSKKCDCGNELALAMEQIAHNAQGGMLIYLRQEGRGIGLFNKINAYALQDKGYDTVEANEKLGFQSDARNYDIVGEIFKHFHITQINLLTNNPRKVSAIEPYAKVVRHSIITPTNPHNEAYLEVKKQKLGHLL
ncbi:MULTISPECIES: GTP cyclohydrolase II [Helicobacter]|uniref:GTP cyclohydrolase-2 n=1 Tax=Helicobacter typhlonius TaxID=76936 RepID=A0A099UE90_9HELI|nr:MULTISPECIES: GTP cyclohydrolase II [Helicobacter]TLD78611.1 GTP cyclohydrolase II [Helicobacter typhlonius]TLD89363.1 GTP cyclohydrolase II [Helicobacter sp. MIT 03-1616]CUU40135.1 GTP cyclohydrolase II [Helicobacter typhlonius]